MTKLRYTPVFIVVTAFVCLAFWPITSHAIEIDCPYPEEEGYDTIPFSDYSLELYLPPDTAELDETIEAIGSVIIWRDAYDAFAENMPTEMIELSASGVSSELGGDFEISLDPDATPSIGIIVPCDTTCEMAKSTFDIHYLITTTMAYPLDTIYGAAEEMELQGGCDAEPGWYPMATGSFLPPYGHTYEGLDKTPLYDNSGAEIGYARLRYELPRRQVPSLTTWGIIILTLVIIISAGYIVLRRRRGMVT